MKPRPFLALLFTFLFFFSSSVVFAKLAPPGTRERKFQRGLLNTALAPVELSKALEEVKKKDTPVPSWLTGGTAGLVRMTIRLVIGIYEIVTFPIPSPKDYQPVYKPEFALEHLGFLKDEA